MTVDTGGNTTGGNTGGETPYFPKFTWGTRNLIGPPGTRILLTQSMEFLHDERFCPKRLFEMANYRPTASSWLPRRMMRRRRAWARGGYFFTLYLLGFLTHCKRPGCMAYSLPARGPRMSGRTRARAICRCVGGGSRYRRRRAAKTDILRVGNAWRRSRWRQRIVGYSTPPMVARVARTGPRANGPGRRRGGTAQGQGMD